MNFSFLRTLALAATAAGVLSSGAIAGDAAKGKIAYVKMAATSAMALWGKAGRLAQSWPRSRCRKKPS